MKHSIMLLAYGEMAPFAYRSLRSDFNIKTIITPPQPESELLLVEHLSKKDHVQIIRTNSNTKIEQQVKKIKPDAVIICSYNKILPASLLKLTKCVNVHHGDLPRWRGRANLNWAIITGRSTVGVTIHEAIPDLDAGSIYVQKKIVISRDETIATLYEKVNRFVEKNLSKVTKKVLAGFAGKPQKGKSTYCCTRLPEDGYIDWNQPSLQIDRLIRALTKPFPGAFTFYKDRKLLIWNSEIPKKPRMYEGRISGRVICFHKNIGVEVLTKDSSIIIKEVTYGNTTTTADKIITTVKTSLGINWIKLHEKLTTV